MNQDLQNLEIKVENDGTTPQGRLTATEWNILVAAVKSLDLTGGSADAASILQVVANAGYATQEWVTSQKYITSLALDNLAKNLVTLDTTQAITGMKDFTNGLKIGGVSVYKSKEGIVFVDGNLAVRGAITMYADNGQAAPSIWDGFPYDDITIKRNAAGKFYAVGGGGSSSGGLDYELLDSYLTTNGYATQSWVTGKGYITSSGSITGNAATATSAQYLYQSNIQESINYPRGADHAIKVVNCTTTQLDGFFADYSTVLSVASPLSNFQIGMYANPFNAWTSHPRFRAMRNTDGTWTDWKELAFVDDLNAYLPLTGGTVNGNIKATSFIGNASSSDRLVEEVVTDLNNATAGRIFTMTSGYGSTDGNKPTTGWVTGITLQYAQSGVYRRQLAYSEVDLYIREEHNGVWEKWRKILTSMNFYDYALPITGGTVSGNLLVTGATTCRDNFRTNDNYYGLSVKSQGSEDNWYGVKTYMQFDEGSTMGVCRIGTAFRYQGLVIGFSTGNDYNYNIPNEYNYTDVFLFGKNGDFLANGALRLGQNNRTCIIENPFAAYGMTLADGNNNNPLVTVSYFNDRAYVFNYKNSNENSGIVFYDDGRAEVHVAENFRIKSKNANLSGIDIGASDTDIWQISHRGSFANNELHFYHNANGTWSNSVLSLTVNGDVATGGNLLIKGAITMNYSSDERLKKNIRKVNASEVLMSLGGVWQYEYIDSEVQRNSTYEGTHYGLIYQNVKGKSLDKMCHKREDGMGALNYVDADFISIIAGTTMENCTEIEKLKKENKALKKRVEQLEKRVA